MAHDLAATAPSAGSTRMDGEAPAGRWSWFGLREPLWPGLASAVLALAAGGSAAAGLPPGTAVGLLAALAVLTAAGAGVWMLVVPSSGRVAALVLGCLLGLGLAGLGVVLSGATGVFALRWVPVALALPAWLPVVRRRGDDRHPGSRRPGIGWGLWGAVAAQLLLLIALRDHLATVPADPAGWRSFYVDIPWHIAFTAEALERAPEVYPWVPDVSLGYTWLFSAALGGWGSATPVTAADLVVRVAPALFAALVPLVAAITAWTVSRSRGAAFLAPVLLVLAQGPLFIFRDTMDITPLWLIPNRDFSNLFVLMAVVVLAGAGQDLPRRRRSLAGTAALLCFLSFTASGAKGSALPVLLGAAGIPVLYALVARRPVAPPLVRLGAVAIGMLVAQNTVTRSLSYLRIDPLTFLGGQTPPGLERVLTALVLVLLLGTLAFVLVTVLPEPRLAERALPLVGGGIAGVAAMALFGHPGLSQLYFLHSAWPLLCVGVAVALTAWTRVVGPATPVTFAVAAIAFTAVLRPPGDEGTRAWGLAALVVLGAVTVTVLGPVLARLGRRPALPRPGLACLAALLSTCFVVQNWGMPAIALPASAASTAEDPAAVGESHRAAYAALAAASERDDLVMTNKHCQSGSVAGGGCDPRWFGVSAFAERRVLVEGWSYTRLSRGVPLEDVYWEPALLARNDAFLADPDPAACRFFVAAGVEWIVVDKREPWSDRLAMVADPLFDSREVAVYRLAPDCAAG